jgi:hypothetical protein
VSSTYCQYIHSLLAPWVRGRLTDCHRRAADTLAALSAPSATVYLCNPVGDPAKLSPFIALMKGHGFRLRLAVPPRDFAPIAVFEFSR